MIAFEWDAEKARNNLRKHGVAFTEAATVFRGRLSITIFDPDHSNIEHRFITIGLSASGRLLIDRSHRPGERNTYHQCA